MQVNFGERDNLGPSKEDKNLFLETPLLSSQKMEALGILACALAHDFNNILTAMIGYTELSLAQIPVDSTIKQNLWEILQAGRRAKELVDQMLRFKREEDDGKKIMQIVPVIKEVCNLLRASSPANVEVKVKIEDENYLLRANPTHIYQILLNLCLNAIQAIGDKYGLLEISLSSWRLDDALVSQYEELKPGPYVCLTVKDTGEGIPPEIMPKIFDPYFTTKRDKQGSGLGLAIVRCLVKSYKGAIFVSSEAGRGTMFQIYLPAIDHRIANDGK